MSGSLDSDVCVTHAEFPDNVQKNSVLQSDRSVLRIKDHEQPMTFVSEFKSF